ncbi:hypothetical protein DFH06DRAFT_1324545 [Mycena polygramma]|nr:hypothetical protein DFH06DRAFT_1324545 [Mycena polygramma]
MPPSTQGMSVDSESGPQRLGLWESPAYESTGGFQETPGLNLTKYKQGDLPLGPWDGSVGASCALTRSPISLRQNANYIPAPPLSEKQKDTHELFNYSAHRCHLGAIRKKPLGDKREVSIMWWNPGADDFLTPDLDRTATRGLGKLRSNRLAQLGAPIDKLYASYKDYMAKGATRSSPLASMVQQLRLAFRTACFWRARGCSDTSPSFKPLMDTPSDSPPPAAQHCVGVFTTDLAIAQQFKRAGIPYWLLRPSWYFEASKPKHPVYHYTVAELGRTRGRARARLSAPQKPSPTTDSKIDLIHRLTSTMAWYKDPFQSAEQGQSVAVDAQQDSPSKRQRSLPPTVDCKRRGSFRQLRWPQFVSPSPVIWPRRRRPRSFLDFCARERGAR